MTLANQATSLNNTPPQKKSRIEPWRASKKHVGAGAQGKGDGSGGLSGNAEIAGNMVLSNRDKEQHSKRARPGWKVGADGTATRYRTASKEIVCRCACPQMLIF